MLPPGPPGSKPDEPTGEHVCRLATDHTTLTRFTDFGDDNSPCALPDGRIVSLWLPNEGHNLKVMTPDGQMTLFLCDQGFATYTDPTQIPGQCLGAPDVADVGITCFGGP